MICILASDDHSQLYGVDERGLLHEDADSGNILELVKGDLLELQVTERAFETLMLP